MREFLWLLLIVFTVLHAQAKGIKDTKAKKLRLTPTAAKVDEARDEDPGSATRLLSKPPQELTQLPTTGGKRIDIKATCKDTLGMVYLQDDPGYAGCLRNQDNRTQPETSSDQRHRPSVGITIGK